jgi:hypothetical protein
MNDIFMNIYMKPNGVYNIGFAYTPDSQVQTQRKLNFRNLMDTNYILA